MWYGNTQQLDLSAFANTQMMYPATGVMLAYLLTRKDDLNLPKWFFRIFTVITLFMLVSTVMTVIQPESTLEMPGGTVSLWLMVMQSIMMIGSILCWIFLLAAGKKRRGGRLRTEMEELEDFTLLYCFVSRTVFFKSRYKLRRIRSIGNIHIHSNQSGHMDLHCFYAAQLPVGLYRLFW